jgi:hypothetical protein
MPGAVIPPKCCLSAADASASVRRTMSASCLRGSLRASELRCRFARAPCYAPVSELDSRGQWQSLSASKSFDFRCRTDATPVIEGEHERRAQRFGPQTLLRRGQGIASPRG